MYGARWMEIIYEHFIQLVTSHWYGGPFPHSNPFLIVSVDAVPDCKLNTYYLNRIAREKYQRQHTGEKQWKYKRIESPSSLLILSVQFSVSSMASSHCCTKHWKPHRPLRQSVENRMTLLWFLMHKQHSHISPPRLSSPTASSTLCCEFVYVILYIVRWSRFRSIGNGVGVAAGRNAPSCKGFK